MKTTADDQFRFWSLWDIFHAFLLGILGGFVLYIVRGVIDEISPFKVPAGLSDGIISSLSMACGTFYLLKEYPVKLSLYGFDKSNIKHSLIWGISFGLVLSAIQFPFKTIFGRGVISSQFFVSIENGIVFVLISIFFATIATPVVEELFYRLCVFRIVKNKLNTAWGYIGTAIIFALSHSNGSFIKFLLSSLILTYVYERKGLIAPCIIAHSIWNMTWFISMYGYECGLFN
jgi:membrane protease YdiL (CAAX protease family)